MGRTWARVRHQVADVPLRPGGNLASNFALHFAQLSIIDLTFHFPASNFFVNFFAQLDYSDELIGGGFKFSNPNAQSSCGCGKSFSA